MPKKLESDVEAYSNWQEADLSTIDHREFEHFDDFCEKGNPEDPESVNRLHFRTHMDELLLNNENAGVLRGCNKRVKELDKNVFIEEILQHFYLERDINHWLLKFSGGLFSLEVFVIDVFSKQLHSFESYSDVSWSDYKTPHVIRQLFGELDIFREEIQVWNDQELKNYWEKN